MKFEPVDALAAGQELGFGDDGTMAFGRSALVAALALGLQAGGALEAGDLVAHVAPGVGARAGAAATAAPGADGRLLLGAGGPGYGRSFVPVGNTIDG